MIQVDIFLNNNQPFNEERTSYTFTVLPRVGEYVELATASDGAQRYIVRKVLHLVEGRDPGIILYVERENIT